MDSEIKLYYKACYIDSVRFYETKYYDKKLYYILMSVLVDGKIREIYMVLIYISTLENHRKAGVGKSPNQSFLFI